MGCKPITAKIRKRKVTGKRVVRRNCWSKEEKDYELLYAITSKNDNSKIENVAQVSGGILGASKVIFFRGIAFLLDVMCPKKFEICYLDTDSLIVTISEDNVEKCVRPEKWQYYLQNKFKVFEDPNGLRHQGGLFKLEGEFKKGYFRSIKNYYLDDEEAETAEDAPVGQIASATFRAKGISQSGQNMLFVRHFKADVDNKDVHTNTWKLRPFANMTMGITPVSRKLNKPLNLKRSFVVRLQLCITQQTLRLLINFLFFTERFAKLSAWIP
jgi:hypothetical protein